MLKKASLFLILVISFCANSFAQKTAELGIFLGRSYYIGEVNPKTHLGNDVGNISYGALFRYNLNERYSLKASYIRTQLQGEDENTIFSFNNEQRLASFETKLREVAVSIEFNFLPYETGSKQKFFSPYLFVGLGYFSYAPETEVIGFPREEVVNEDGGYGLSYIIGPGLKLSLSRKLSLGFEWGFRKTGIDQLDGLENRIFETFESGKPYDNDWYVHSGFTLTYNITPTGPCPAYNF